MSEDSNMSRTNSILSRKEGSQGGDEITRCICGNEDFVTTPRTKALNAIPGLYVQCENCHVWQHGFCMGFSSEDAIPDVYYCEKCKPSFHSLHHRHGVLLSKYQPHEEIEPHQSPEEDSNEKPANDPTEPLTKDETNDQPASTTPNESEVPNQSNNITETPSKSPDTTKPDDNPDTNVDESRESLKAENQDLEALNDDDDDKRSSEPKSGYMKKQRKDSASESRRVDRKTRKSEHEILQRVLRESAKEAENAERRRQGLPDLPSDSEAGEPDQVSARSELESDANEETTVRRTRPPGRPSSSGRGRGRGRGGARRGPKPRGGVDKSSYVAPGGSKKCKPKIPSSRSTFSDMFRRVANLLDFTSRTQADLVSEKDEGLPGLLGKNCTRQVSLEVSNLTSICEKNITNLENLTKKLLDWEDKYNAHNSP